MSDREMSLRLAREYKEKGQTTKSSHFYEVSENKNEKENLSEKEIGIALFEWSEMIRETDSEKSMEILIKSADLGNSEAQHVLSTVYSTQVFLLAEKYIIWTAVMIIKRFLR